MASDPESLQRLLLDVKKHSGPDGFEGLVVALLEGATGLRFHLSKSGDQRGVDAATFRGIRVGMEAKHYNVSDLDHKDILGGCSRALYEDYERPLDLWILASTKHIPSQLRQDLDKLCRACHCDFLALDRTQDGLSVLEVLCVSQKDRLRDFIHPRYGELWTSETDDCILNLQSHREYLAHLAALIRQLSEPTVGYDPWSTAIKQALAARILDPIECRRFFGAIHSDLALPLRKSVRRRKLEELLWEWWKGQAGNPIVVLGDEGIGKSWGCLFWLLNEIQPVGPPIIPIPSRLRTRDSLLACIANVSAAVLERATEQQWEARFRRWAKGNRLWCLPYLDGLGENENPETLSAILGDSSPMVATSRAQAWQRRFSCWSLEQQHPKWDASFVLEGLSDDEFKELCCLREVNIAQFSPETQDLMRKPRYFELALRAKSDALADYIVSPDLLLALDWEDRIIRNSSLQHRSGLDRDRFQLGIRRLCTEYEGRAETSSLSEIFGASEPRSLVQLFEEEEIFRFDPLLGKWRVHSDFLVLGVGLAMAAEVRGLDPQTDLVSSISMSMEPAPEMDLKADACGKACLLVWREAGPDSVEFIAFLKVWLELPNAERQEQRDLLKRVADDHRFFVPAMEALWTSTGSSQGQELLLERLYSIPSTSESADAVWSQLITSWIGLHLTSGHPIDNRLRMPRASVREEILGYSTALSDARPWCAYLRRLPDDKRALMRLRFIALDLIHRISDRRRFAPALIAWLVASSLNQSWDDEQYFIWIVETHFDELWPELEKLSELLSNDCAVEKRAKEMLHSFVDRQNSQNPVPPSTVVRFGASVIKDGVLDPKFVVEPPEQEQIGLVCEKLKADPNALQSELEHWLHYGLARDPKVVEFLLDSVVDGLVETKFEALFKGLVFLVEDYAEFLTAAALGPLQRIRERILSEEFVLESKRNWAEAVVAKLIAMVDEASTLWSVQRSRPIWQAGYGPLTFAPEEHFEPAVYKSVTDPASTEELGNALRYLKWFPHNQPLPTREKIAAVCGDAQYDTLRLNAIDALLAVDTPDVGLAKNLLELPPKLFEGWHSRIYLAELIVSVSCSLPFNILINRCPVELILKAVVLRGSRPEELAEVARRFRAAFTTSYPDFVILKGELRPFRVHDLNLTYPELDQPSEASPFGVERKDYRDWWGGARSELDPLPGNFSFGPTDSRVFEEQWQNYRNARAKNVESGNPWWGSFWDGGNLERVIEVDPDLLALWIEGFRGDHAYSTPSRS